MAQLQHTMNAPRPSQADASVPAAIPREKFQADVPTCGQAAPRQNFALYCQQPTGLKTHGSIDFN